MKILWIIGIFASAILGWAALVFLGWAGLLWLFRTHVVADPQIVMMQVFGLYLGLALYVWLLGYPTTWYIEKGFDWLDRRNPLTIPKDSPK